MILVTGGCGFIGNELVRQLKAGGQRVVILDNRQRVAPAIDDLVDVPVVDVDITDNVKMRRVMDGLRPEVVFHMAAMHFIPECNANPEMTLRVNVEGSLSAFNAACAAGVRHFVFASSGAVYADSVKPLAESLPVAPVDIYGWSKKFSEDIYRLLSAELKVPVTMCRLFNNYGPRETNAHIIPEIVSQLRNGRSLSLGNIAPIRDYIHTTDTAKALIRLGLRTAPSTIAVNVGSGKGTSVRDIINHIGNILGFAIEVREDPKRFRKVDKAAQIADIALLKELTGWEPEVRLEDGIRELMSFEGLMAEKGAG